MLRREELPRGLPERKALHANSSALLELLDDRPNDVRRTPWESTWRRDDNALCLRETQSSEPIVEVRVEYPPTLMRFNARLTKIAEAVAPVEEALVLAGLTEGDRELWRLHRNTPSAAWVHAAHIGRNPDSLFMEDDGYECAFSFKEPSAHNLQQQERASNAVALLRRAAMRIERTVSPQAVLDRLRISDDRTEVILDRVVYRPLHPKSEGAYLYLLRQGAGEWVSSKFIADQLRVVEFKVNRPNKTLARLPPLRAIIESEGGNGGRIVLPLPPD